MIPCTTIGLVIGAPEWKGRTTKTLAIASRAAEAVSGQATAYFRGVSLAKRLWSLDRSLREFLEGIYKDLESGKYRNAPTPTDEQMREAIASLREIFNRIDRMYSIAREGGLTNWSLVGAVLNSVRMRAEEILDFAESMEIAMDPTVDALFEDAVNDLHEGKALDLGAFK